MKKQQVLQHLPNLKQYKKELKAADAAITRLEKQVDRLDELVGYLDQVVVYNDFPILVNESDNLNGSPAVEVWSACDETSRYAYVSRDSSPEVAPERWRATGYREEGDGNGKALVEGVSRLAAIRAGKDFVSTGKVGKVEKATKKNKATA